jgi:hypothetical protein
MGMHVCDLKTVFILPAIYTAPRHCLSLPVKLQPSDRASNPPYCWHEEQVSPSFHAVGLGIKNEFHPQQTSDCLFRKCCW